MTVPANPRNQPDQNARTPRANVVSVLILILFVAAGAVTTIALGNPVPLVVTGDGLRVRDGGELADLAPTVLELVGVPVPEAMTGRSLVTDDR